MFVNKGSWRRFEQTTAAVRGFIEMWIELYRQREYGDFAVRSQPATQPAGRSRRDV
jgi:hypothetical protein